LFDVGSWAGRWVVVLLGQGRVFGGIEPCDEPVHGLAGARQLAQTRPDAKGALLFEACVPVSEFGTAWPDEVPVQVHGMDADPFFAGEGDIDAARELVEQAKDAALFLYPGGQHLFADSSLPSYDPEATALLVQRVLEFLAAP
jgi:dienelactone hydrolase